ncbi:unnamed protein product [Sphagnum balticum]
MGGRSGWCTVASSIGDQSDHTLLCMQRTCTHTTERPSSGTISKVKWPCIRPVSHTCHPLATPTNTPAHDRSATVAIHWARLLHSRPNTNNADSATGSGWLLKLRQKFMKWQHTLVRVQRMCPDQSQSIVHIFSNAHVRHRLHGVGTRAACEWRQGSPHIITELD